MYLLKPQPELFDIFDIQEQRNTEWNLMAKAALSLCLIVMFNTSIQHEWKDNRTDVIDVQGVEWLSGTFLGYQSPVSLFA